MSGGALRLRLAVGAICLSALCGAAAAQTPPSPRPSGSATSSNPNASSPPPTVPGTPLAPPKAGSPPPLATPSPALQTLTGLPEATQTSEVVRVALVLTLLVLLPAIAICMTPFIRIVVVLSMIRHAFGMPETPPNQVLISLALFLTVFSMGSTLQAVNTEALQPFLSGSIPINEAVEKGSAPERRFMLRQVHEDDIRTIYSISHQPLPARAADVSLVNLIPAYMLNELRVSFKMGFVIFLPFLLIDIIVASVLLSLGMLMVPPATISLPVKILMFVLIDGWSLVLQSVVASVR